MPPSGYSKLQSGAIGEFLRSCSVALEQEGRGRGDGPLAALQQECSDIDRALSDGFDDSFARCVLQLTREFYAGVASQKPDDYGQFRQSVDRCLKRVEESILAVHIEPLEMSQASST